MAALHLPALRQGVPYRSMDRLALDGGRVEVSQVNGGLIRRDLLRSRAASAALDALPARRLLAICAEAGQRFLGDRLPLGDGGDLQGPDDYVRLASATGGLPHALIRANMAKIAHVLTHLEGVLAGLTRGLDPDVLDSGLGRQAGVPVSFYRTTDALGVVLPSNSPGVNSLWLPAIALKTPVALKPGRDDPWTPWRIIQALLAAGCPPAALSFYPAGHEGAHALLGASGRSLLFGDAAITRRYAGDPAVEIHGPGHSKVLLGRDQAPRWEAHLEVLAASVAANGGRSCVNASAIYCDTGADALAAGLARHLATLVPRDADDPAAALAGFASAAAAESISAAIDAALREPGAEDVSQRLRGTPRLATHQGRTYLLPTVIRCADPDHPLARREYPFPFCAVVEVDQDRQPEAMGPSLVVSAIGDDPVWRRRLLASPLVHRLNLGPMATSHVHWDQPHEGNLFEFLYRRRAVQAVG